MDHGGRFRELSDLLKHCNIHIIGIPEDEDRGKKGQKVYSDKL